MKMKKKAQANMWRPSGQKRQDDFCYLESMLISKKNAILKICNSLVTDFLNWSFENDKEVMNSLVHVDI